MRGARVLDVSTDVAGAWCARLLGMAGAEVIKVEPPAGDPLRHAPPFVPSSAEGGLTSATFAYLNAYKQGIALDTACSTGEMVLSRMITAMDAVVSTFEGDVAAVNQIQRLIAAHNPRAVHTVVSSYGLTGPYAAYQRSDLTDWAVSGYLQITGDPEREPLQGGGPWCSYATGLTAANGTVAAMLYARLTGRGQLVDAGLMEAMAALHQWSIVLYTHQGVTKRRSGNRHAEAHHLMGLQPCKDGWVCIGTASPQQWEHFCLAIDMPELLADSRFATGGDRFDHADTLDEIIAVWLSPRTRDEVVDHLQQHRVPASRVLPLTELLDDPQLEARSFWDTPARLSPGARMPGIPFRIGERREPWREAPHLGEHTLTLLVRAGFNQTEIDWLVATGVVFPAGTVS